MQAKAKEKTTEKRIIETSTKHEPHSKKQKIEKLTVSKSESSESSSESSESSEEDKDIPQSKVVATTSSTAIQKKVATPLVNTKLVNSHVPTKAPQPISKPLVKKVEIAKKKESSSSSSSDSSDSSSDTGSDAPKPPTKVTIPSSKNNSTSNLIVNSSSNSKLPTSTSSSKDKAPPPSLKPSKLKDTAAILPKQVQETNNVNKSANSNGSNSKTKHPFSTQDDFLSNKSVILVAASSRSSSSTVAPIIKPIRDYNSFPVISKSNPPKVCQAIQ